MRLLALISLVFNSFLSFGQDAKITRKTDFDKEDAYYILNDYEYVISEDTNITEKDFRDTIYNLHSTPDLNMKFEKPDTFKISIPKKHYLAKRYVKLKLNTIKGAENWAYFLLSSDFFSEVQYLSIKIIKPEGKIIDVDSKSFLNKAWFFKNENKADTFKYKIEEIKPGDIVEAVYLSDYSKSNYFKMNGKFCFASNLASLKTSCRCILPKNYKVFYKTYNGLKPPVFLLDSITNKKTVAFSADSTDMITDLNNTSLINEFPYLVYKIDKDNIQKADLLKIYNDFFNTVNSSSEVDLTWIMGNMESLSINNKYLKLKFLYNTNYRNFENSNYTFILGHKVSQNENELLEFYVHLFNYLKIDFYLGIALDKYSGDIDLETMNVKDLHYMLMYYDDNNILNYIYPNKNNIKYFINEFPGILNGGKAIIMKQKGKMNQGNAKDTSELEIKHITIRGGLDNNVKVQRLVKVNLDNKKSNINSTIEYSGFCSLKRHLIQPSVINPNYIYYQQNKPLVKYSILDSKVESKYPFLYSFKTQSNEDKLFDYLNDSTLSISLKKLISFYPERFKNNRNTSILLPYNYSDIHTVTFEFPKQVKLINKELFNKIIDNQTGMLNCNIEENENKQIVIKTIYSIKKEHIPADSINELLEINNIADSILNSKLVIRIK